MLPFKRNYRAIQRKEGAERFQSCPVSPSTAVAAAGGAAEHQE